jgi:hypothetical protein
VQSGNSVRDALPHGAALLDITDGGCSCSFYRSEMKREPWSESSLRARYARKGWSDAKIARAVDAKLAAHARRAGGGVQRQFCRSIEVLVAGGALVALVSHHYSGLFATENVSICGRGIIALRDFLTHEGTFPEDMLVSIT